MYAIERYATVCKYILESQRNQRKQ